MQAVERGGLQGRGEFESAGVAQDFPHQDRVLRFPEQEVIFILLDDDHLALEFGQVFFHRVVDVYLAFIDEHHQGGSGHRLGHGGDPE